MILAHDVGHTCWQRGTATCRPLDVFAIPAEPTTAVNVGEDPAEVRDYFESWMPELICDARARTRPEPARWKSMRPNVPAPNGGLPIAARLGTSAAEDATAGGFRDKAGESPGIM